VAELTRSDNVLSDLFSDDGSRRNVTVYLTVLAVGLLYHASVFWFIMGDEIQAKDEQITYAIEFEETPEQFSDSRTINDGEKETLEFTASADLFNSKSGFGLLTITISYAETSGEFADPCDTVSANLVVTDVPADWNHGNNVLSGVSSDCETIDLTLYIYPEYDGEPKEVTGMDASHWSDVWSDSSYGQGIFELDIEVIVNEPITSGIPTVSDTDERVEVTWEAVFFDVSVQETS
tara:strand:+ start:1300 stop:2004 length:705 start_codon:yes stop_codon:yes gene_type:complete